LGPAHGNDSLSSQALLSALCRALVHGKDVAVQKVAFAAQNGWTAKEAFLVVMGHSIDNS
jgi:hypothetical protein